MVKKYYCTDLLQDRSLPPSFVYNCNVVQNEPVNNQYIHMIVDAPQEMVRQTLPGQFYHILCPASGERTPYLRRPMSIYRYDNVSNQLHFLYKTHGIGTSTLAELQIGDELSVVGPLGLGFVLNPNWKTIIILARGVGLATLAALVQKTQETDIKVIAICSAREPKYLLSIDWFKSHGAKVITVTDAEGTSSVENLDNVISELIEQGNGDALFTCGSQRLLKLLQRLGKKYEIPGQIAIEQQMACGLGMCQCCVRSFVKQDNGEVSLRVCKEGPVFDLQEALTW